MNINASEIINFRHGRSKERQLYGRSKTLWGLQVFDNISWSLSLFNETDDIELLHTTFSMRTNETLYDGIKSSRIKLHLNKTNMKHTNNNALIGEKLEKDLIIKSYLTAPSSIKPRELDQFKVSRILNYENHNANPFEFGSDSSRFEISNRDTYQNGTSESLKYSTISAFEPISKSFKRHKKNRKLHDSQYKSPTKRYDILTEHLQIIESQNSKDCTAGTSKSLGEGVVDNSRFQIEANVAVNRANMLTR